MRFAFVIDPLASLKAYKDSSVAMMRAAVAAGHTCFAIEPGQIWAAPAIDGQAGVITCQAQPLTVHADAVHWYDAAPAVEMPLATFDAVLIRKDPPFDAEYLYLTQLLSQAETQGAKVFNRPQSLRDYNEKLAILAYAQWTVPTLVSRDIARLRAFIVEHGDAILKPLDGMGGMGIYRLTPSDPNLSMILEAASQDGAHTLMVQRYIPQIRAGDKRILIINGEPLPYALARIPQQGETRGNLAAGGRGVAQPLTPQDLAIAQSVGPMLKAAGLFLVGLDVIGDYLTEINVTSPTCMVEIAAQTDCDPAAQAIAALSALVAG